MIWKRIFFLFLFFISASLGICQPAELININKKAGLGTDFIYQMLVDRYGYLWLATPKGVIKYNGYEAKIFDVSSGLPNEDVWALFEDNKGRIWCSSHSNRIGYIKNDVFKLVENKDFDETLFPNDVKNYKKGIAFSTWGNFFYEKNDTLYKKAIPGLTNDINLQQPTGSVSFVNNKNELLVINEKRFFKLRNVEGKPETVFDYQPVVNGTKTAGPYFDLVKRYEAPSRFNDDIINNTLVDDIFLVLRKAKLETINFDVVKQNKFKFISFYRVGDYFYLRFDKAILQIDSTYSIQHLFSLEKIGLPGSVVPMIMPDKLWDTLISTNTNGLLVHKAVENTFKKEEIELTGCNLLGAVSDISIWWQNTSHNLIVVNGNKITKKIKFPNFVVQSLLPFSRDKVLLLLSLFKGYWLNPESCSLSTELSIPYFAYHKSTAINKKRSRFMSVGSSRIMLYDISEHGTSNPVVIENERFEKLFYDEFYDCFVFSKYDKLGIYKDRKKIIFNKRQLSLLHISSINDIVTDNKGNWFVKDNKAVHWVNIKNLFAKRLPSYVNLSDTRMLSFKNNLIIGGQFGLCFYKFSKDKFLGYYMKANNRSVFYEKIYNLWGATDGILLNTDKGTYSYELPADTFFNVGVNDQMKYALLAKYDTSVFSNMGGDTIFIDQNNKRLILDVINPLGTGKPHYAYRIDNDEDYTNLTNNELYLEDIVSKGYHQLNITIQDNGWISGKNSFYIYLIPFWWQTNYGKAIIALCILVILLLVAFVAFAITQHNIKKRNERNQLQMDIELKSIYSQINPHFIFNTLSGTQYFIRENRNQDARLHLNNFSRLLRSYIHSSRNKYISIKDELGNLVNYIELQQIRFVDKFDYEVVVAEDLQADQVKIPSLLLQPIVENAINHGLFHIEGYKGLLRLVFSRNVQTNEVICVVDDNGVGRSKAREIKADSIVKAQSYGDALIKDLINIFNKYEKLNIGIEYIDKVEPLTGTTVTIKIKNPVYESRAN